MKYHRTTSVAPIEPIAVAIPEAARLIGVPVETLRTWIARGAIPSFKLEGRRLILRADLDAKIEAAMGSHDR